MIALPAQRHTISASAHRHERVADLEGDQVEASVSAPFDPLACAGSRESAQSSPSAMAPGRTPRSPPGSWRTRVAVADRPLTVSTVQSTRFAPTCALRSSSGAPARVSNTFDPHVPGASLPPCGPEGAVSAIRPQEARSWATWLRGAWLRRARCARRPLDVLLDGAGLAARGQRRALAPPAREPSAQSLTGSGELTGTRQQRHLGRSVSRPCTGTRSPPGSIEPLEHRVPIAAANEEPNCRRARRAPGSRAAAKRRLVELDGRRISGLGSRGHRRAGVARRRVARLDEVADSAVQRPVARGSRPPSSASRSATSGGGDKALARPRLLGAARQYSMPSGTSSAARSRPPRRAPWPYLQEVEVIRASRAGMLVASCRRPGRPAAWPACVSGSRPSADGFFFCGISALARAVGVGERHGRTPGWRRSRSPGRVGSDASPRWRALAEQLDVRHRPSHATSLVCSIIPSGSQSGVGDDAFDGAAARTAAATGPAGDAARRGPRSTCARVSVAQGRIGVTQEQVSDRGRLGRLQIGVVGRARGRACRASTATWSVGASCSCRTAPRAVRRSPNAKGLAGVDASPRSAVSRRRSAHASLDCGLARIEGVTERWVPRELVAGNRMQLEQPSHEGPRVVAGPGRRPRSRRLHARDPRERQAASEPRAMCALGGVAAAASSPAAACRTSARRTAEARLRHGRRSRRCAAD